MKKVKTIIIVILAVLLFSCVATRFSKNKFGHYHDYPYKSPQGVKKTDEAECSVIADKMAFKALNEYVAAASGGPSIYSAFGLLGTIAELSVEGSRINKLLNTTYEQNIKSCLHEKGYNFEDLEN